MADAARREDPRRRRQARAQARRLGPAGHEICLAARSRASARPVSQWFRGELGDQLEHQLRRRRDQRARLVLDARCGAGSLDLHRTGRADRSFQLWNLLNLSVWFDHWIAGREPAAPDERSCSSSSARGRTSSRWRRCSTPCASALERARTRCCTPASTTTAVLSDAFLEQLGLARARLRSGRRLRHATPSRRRPCSSASRACCAEERFDARARRRRRQLDDGRGAGGGEARRAGDPPGGGAALARLDDARGDQPGRHRPRLGPAAVPLPRRRSTTSLAEGIDRARVGRSWATR